MLYTYINNSRLEEALQFWSRGDRLNLCVAERSHVPYLRHNVIDLIGQPDRMMGNHLYYDRVPVSLYSMEEDGEDIPDGAFYIPSAKGDMLGVFGFYSWDATSELEVATVMMCQGIELDIISLVRE